MSRQRLKALQIEKQKQPLLSNWAAQWNEVALARTFYEGWSPHITAATTSGGLYIGSGQKRVHPNFFTAGSGQVTYSATDATFESSVDTALTNLTDTSTDYFSTDLLEAMRVEVIKLKIKPMVTENGMEFWPMLIHPNQARQLRADSDWQGVNQRAWVANEAKNNPIFSGAIGSYAGFVLYERMLGVFGASPSGTGTVTFGATNPLSAPDTYARKCAIIFGAGAISRGVAEDLSFERETDDYGNVLGIGAGMIVGDSRGEYYDSTTSVTGVINQTSAIVATYSDNSF